MARPSFGLTSLSKEDLFLDDLISICLYYPGCSYWDAYMLPVPIRNHMIRKYVEIHTPKEQQQSKPLPPPTTFKSANPNVFGPAR